MTKFAEQKILSIVFELKTQTGNAAAATTQFAESPSIPPVNYQDLNTSHLTLRLLMSYIYGAPSKARKANVVYIWTYVWQR